MNIYLNSVIESLKQKIKCYKQNSETYAELGLMFNAKYEREI